MGKVRVNLLMQESLHEELQEIAKRDERAVSDVMRQACREYIYRDKRKGISSYFKDVEEQDNE